jgi:superfamily II DNA or RNA helicase
MALRLNPIRLLVADDVGIGKTIEAALIAREMLDRGEINRLAVLCPPQLAEQWQSELRDKFHIDAELVLPGTAHRLERHCRVGQSLFDLHPFVIVSLDFIKSERRVDEFLRVCPEFVILDEAHACTAADTSRSGHQRHRLVKGLAANPDRHILLVTATPHSGKEDAFRSLLGLLDPDFINLPENLAGEVNRKHRERLAAHMVQRRRKDIRRFMDADTPFPERMHAEETYRLSPDYTRLLQKAVDYAKETIADTGERGFRQRIRWWSAIALLRSIASSPAAAAATLRSRASSADTSSVEDADEVGRRAVMDLDVDESTEGSDVAPGADLTEELTGGAARRRLLDMARDAEKLHGEKDTKLTKAVDLVKRLVNDGFRPIVFCRFIPTAEYLAEELRSRMGRGIEIASVTGLLPPEDREARVAALGNHPKRVLVATDCLSEGVNLQEHFDAIVHYDLPWNPTRLEQREGRVDRFGQSRPEVRVVTYYGIDNGIDGKVLDILLRKHRAIRNALGISVPVPVNTEQFVEAIFEGLLMSEGFRPAAAQLEFDQFMAPKKEDLLAKWDAASEKENKSRTLFAQETLKVEDVSRELAAAREAVGLGVDVASFTRAALESHGAAITGDGRFTADLRNTPRALRDMLGAGDSFSARFEPPISGGELLLTRTHPLVEGLSSHVMDTALDPTVKSIARRCGVIRTKAVATRTTLLLLRLRYHIIKTASGKTEPLLAEDCCTLGFTGAPESAVWIPAAAVEQILLSKPDANVPADMGADFVRKVVEGFEHIRPQLEETARQRGRDLLDAHMRVRESYGGERWKRKKPAKCEVEPHLPVDVLGVYVYLPAS